MIGFSFGSADRNVMVPVLYGLSRMGPMTTAWPGYGSPSPSSKYGAGAKINSRSGNSRSARLLTNPYASPTLDVSMPRLRMK
jgi:hypothetical protein